MHMPMRVARHAALMSSGRSRPDLIHRAEVSSTAACTLPGRAVAVRHPTSAVATICPDE